MRTSFVLGCLFAVGCTGTSEPMDVDAGVQRTALSLTEAPPATAGRTSPEQASWALEQAAAIAERAEPWLAGALRSDDVGLTKMGTAFVGRGRDNQGVPDGDLSLRAEIDVQKGLAFGLGGVARFHTTLVPVGAASVQGAAAGHRVAWHDPWPSTDVLLVAGARFAELAVLLRDARAPHRFAFTAKLPKSLHDGGVDGAGDRLLVDGQGQPVLRIRAPFVVDARGDKRAARVTFEADELAFDFDPSGLRYPALLDPTLDVPSWSKLTTSHPTNPEGPVVVNTGGKVWSVNGTNGETYTASSTTYDPTAFVTAWGTSTGPGGRRYAAGAADPNGDLVVFGGWNGSGAGALNTWSVRTTSWSADTTLTVGGIVSGRVGTGGTGFKACGVGVIGCTTYRQGTIFWGGNAGTTVYTDLFLRESGSTFYKLVPDVSAGTPNKRAHMLFVGDGFGKIYMAGGIDTATSTRLADTWRLDLTYVLSPSSWTAAWTPICGAAGKPACGFSARHAAASALDKARNRVIMVGGDSGSKLAETVEFNPGTGTWTDICGTSKTPACATGFAGRSGAGITCLKVGTSTSTRCYMMGGVTSAGPIQEAWVYWVHGNACTYDTECDTGSCQDGACCESATACGTCKACNVKGSEGTCAFVTAASTGPSCSAPSACDGAGACLLTTGQSCATSTQCLSGFCADGYCCNTACGGACDTCAAVKGAAANGKCTVLAAGAVGEPSCAPAVCSGASAVCPGGCSKDADCSSTSYCAIDGKCKSKKALGATCAPASDCFGGACGMCASGNCVDGVCCDGACDGLCQACSKARKGTTAEDGKCGYAADGEVDKLGRCVDSGTAADTGCKTDGKCGGAGACRYYGKTTSCGGSGATCVGNSASGRFCDGTGLCAASGGTSDCAPFKCVDGVGCPTSCSKDTDCVSSAFCDGGACKPKLLAGIACKEARECVDGVCADGNCCERPCDGLCEACNVKGVEGKCAPTIGAPAAGHGSCPAGDPTKPCEAPSCDGTVRDKCIGRPGGDVLCQEKSCKDGVEKPEARCDGKGTCAASTPRNCAPYVCALDGCRDKCTSNADCTGTTTCEIASGKCVNSGRCDADGYTAVSGDGITKQDCRPFKCEANGTCKNTCGSSADCVAPNLCDPTTNKCAAPDAAGGATDDSGGCTHGHAQGGALGALFGVIALGLLRRRR